MQEYSLNGHTYIAPYRSNYPVVICPYDCVDARRDALTGHPHCIAANTNVLRVGFAAERQKTQTECDYIRNRSEWICRIHEVTLPASRKIVSENVTLKPLEKLPQEFEALSFPYVFNEVGIAFTAR